jgi:hypothetical protein
MNANDFTAKYRGPEFDGSYSFGDFAHRRPWSFVKRDRERHFFWRYFHQTFCVGSVYISNSTPDSVIRVSLIKSEHFHLSLFGKAAV